MALADDFKTFVEALTPDDIETMKTTVGEIAKKLNNNYYNLVGEKSEHMYIVGSIGRGTAIKGVSDLDLLFNLPSTVYSKYNAYESNGQSALLQEVKNVLKERYPKTKMSGDGQVVVIEFTNYTVELVPGFKQSDDSFKYPDTNSGGYWKTTNPLPEIETSHTMADDTDNNFTHMCNMLRAWKNNIGFKFGGLLIDSLVYKFLNENENYKNIDYSDYFAMTKDLFKYLKDLNKEQAYWFALGSNQKVYNKDKGKFIDKAKKAYNKISSYDGSESDVNTKLREIFGSQFPKVSTVTESACELASKKTEQFIYNLFPVDIQNNLSIDCEVTQSGFRPFMLRYLLNKNKLLPVNKSLKFTITECDVEGDYDIYWKVRNEGAEAIKRDQIRGQITKTNSSQHVERTSFDGAHYVECYIVKNGVCVAKDKIDVPISSYASQVLE
jgi:hypothetical protein